MTLAEILEKLANLDNAAEDIVPEDAAQIAGDLTDKVDAIQKVLTRLGLEQARLLGVRDDMVKAAAQVGRNADRLEEYLLFAMRAQGFDKLPGKLYRVQVQNATPCLQVERNPNADDFLALGENVVRRKVVYEWQKDAIKKSLAEGGSFEHGKLVTKQIPRFYVNKGAEK